MATKRRASGQPRESSRFSTPTLSGALRPSASVVSGLTKMDTRRCAIQGCAKNESPSPAMRLRVTTLYTYEHVFGTCLGSTKRAPMASINLSDHMLFQCVRRWMVSTMIFSTGCPWRSSSSNQKLQHLNKYCTECPIAPALQSQYTVPAVLLRMRQTADHWCVLFEHGIADMLRLLRSNVG